jgi:hypothetical protein
MDLRRFLPWGAAVALSPLLGACVPMTPPAISSGSSASKTGVVVSVVGQRCSETIEPELPGADLVEETLQVRVENRAASPATVHRDRFRVIAPDGSALQPRTWNAADPISVAEGTSASFDLRFMTRGSLECRKGMQLDPDGGIELASVPVALGPVSFTPDRDL